LAEIDKRGLEAKLDFYADSEVSICLRNFVQKTTWAAKVGVIWAPNPNRIPPFAAGDGGGLGE
jgi:hypothetical protein